MKKMLSMAVLMGLVTSMANAGCVGPFCWDDTGAAIGGVINDGNGAGVPLLTKVQEAAATPKAKGQEIFCTNCTNFNSGLGYPCVSTGTTAGAYVAISSATAATACQ